MKYEGKNQKTIEKQKISAMVLKVAEGYIDMGDTTEERENYLRSACSAWNIADESDCKAIEKDFSLLIKQTYKLYPNVDI